jgi:hypothetical protein
VLGIGHSYTATKATCSSVPVLNSSVFPGEDGCSISDTADIYSIHMEIDSFAFIDGKNTVSLKIVLKYTYVKVSILTMRKYTLSSVT